jgi:hypothetical protein
MTDRPEPGDCVMIDTIGTVKSVDGDGSVVVEIDGKELRLRECEYDA